MTYRIYYVTDNGKRFTDKIEATSKKNAENKLRDKYSDIKEIVQITEA